jgi:hypothetical protein
MKKVMEEFAGWTLAPTAAELNRRKYVGPHGGRFTKQTVQNLRDRIAEVDAVDAAPRGGAIPGLLERPGGEVSEDQPLTETQRAAFDRLTASIEEYRKTPRAQADLRRNNENKDAEANRERSRKGLRPLTYDEWRRVEELQEMPRVKYHPNKELTALLDSRPPAPLGEGRMGSGFGSAYKAEMGRRDSGEAWQSMEELQARAEYGWHRMFKFPVPPEVAVAVRAFNMAHGPYPDLQAERNRRDDEMLWEANLANVVGDAILEAWARADYLTLADLQEVEAKVRGMEEEAERAWNAAKKDAKEKVEVAKAISAKYRDRFFKWWPEVKIKEGNPKGTALRKALECAGLIVNSAKEAAAAARVVGIDADHNTIGSYTVWLLVQDAERIEGDLREDGATVPGLDSGWWATAKAEEAARVKKAEDAEARRWAAKRAGWAAEKARAAEKRAEWAARKTQEDTETVP